MKHKSLVLVLTLIVLLLFAFYLLNTPNDKEIKQSIPKNQELKNKESLKDKIENENLPFYEREKAIFSLVDGSLKNATYNESRDYLKRLILEGKLKGELKSVALANIFLIDEIFPREKFGSIEVIVKGSISKGKRINIIVRFYSEKSAKARIKVGSFGYDSLEKPPLIPLNKTIWKGNITANKSIELSFPFFVEREGKFEIPVSYKLSFDPVDYEKGSLSLYFDTYNESVRTGER